MSFFNPDANPAAALNDRAKNAALARADYLAEKQETAISAFRATVNTLQDVNTSLDDDIASFESLIAFYTGQKEAAEKAKADNAAVIENILKIIGH